MKKRFKQFLSESRGRAEPALLARAMLLEHETYKRIPGTNKSYRIDAEDTNTLTMRHAHVYAKQEGEGGQLYSVNVDGSGHDGSSGVTVPAKHAEFLRKKGFKIGDDNILECLSIEKAEAAQLFVVIVEGAEQPD